MSLALKLEAHDLPISHFYLRNLVDTSSVGKMPNERLSYRLAHHAGTQGFEFDSLGILPLSSVIMHLSHRSHAHVVNRLTFGIKRQQTRFGHRSDRSLSCIC